MPIFKLADYYRTVKILLSSDIIQLRQEAFDTMTEDLNAEKALELTRRYYGLPINDSSSWFVDSFRTTDASFSLIDNDREAAVLSAGLLKAGINAKKDFISLVVLSTSILGNRTPAISIDIIGSAQNSLDEISVDERKHKILNIDNIRNASKTSLPTDFPASNFQQAAGYIKTVNDEWRAAVNSLASQVKTTLTSFKNEIEFFREEADMLWWYIGGCSRIIDQPFSGISPASSAVLAGIDLADLSTTIAGPVAARAILQKITTEIQGKGKNKSKKFTIHDAVNGLKESDLQKLEFQDSLCNIFDICPVLTAFSKAKEIGGGTAWHSSFSKATHLKPDTQFTLFELALQAYRECLVTRV